MTVVAAAGHEIGKRGLLQPRLPVVHERLHLAPARDDIAEPQPGAEAFGERAEVDHAVRAVQPLEADRTTALDPSRGTIATAPAGPRYGPRNAAIVAAPQHRGGNDDSRHAFMSENARAETRNETAVLPAVLCGQPRPLGLKGHLSGIAKARVEGPYRVTRLGLMGDAQADLKHHGGPEKALHHYPFDHYADWRHEIGGNDLLDAPGAFGENLSTSGWTEHTVHIGDIVGFGSARLQVSQGRQPCWKLNVRFGRTDLAYRTQTTGRTGWYYRVLEEGTAEPSDPLILIERPRPQWPLARLSALLYHRKDHYEELAAMAEIPELAEGWRTLAARRVATRATESWATRLNEPE